MENFARPLHNMWLGGEMSSIITRHTTLLLYCQWLDITLYVNIVNIRFTQDTLSTTRRTTEHTASGGLSSQVSPVLV